MGLSLYTSDRNPILNIASGSIVTSLVTVGRLDFVDVDLEAFETILLSAFGAFGSME